MFQTDEFHRLGRQLQTKDRLELRNSYYSWPLNGTESMESVTKRLFSFVIVREPFARLVSGYRQKMIHDWEKETDFR